MKKEEGFKFGLVIAAIAIFLFVGMSAVSASETPLPVDNGSVSWWKGMTIEDIAIELVRDEPPSGNNPSNSCYSCGLKGKMFMELCNKDPKTAGEVFNRVCILDIEKARSIIDNAMNDINEGMPGNLSVLGKALRDMDRNCIVDFVDLSDQQPQYRHYYYREAAYVVSVIPPMLASEILINLNNRNDVGEILEEVAEVDLKAHAKIIGWLWVLG